MVPTTSSTETMSRRDTTLTRRQVEGMIADGQTIIIVDGKVLRVDAWLKYHPGGDKAIMHMVGRDATDEVNAYVNLFHLTQLPFLTMTFVLDFILQKHASECQPFRLVRLTVVGGIFFRPSKVVDLEHISRERAGLSMGTRTIRRVRAALHPNRLFSMRLAVADIGRTRICRFCQKSLHFLQCHQ